MKKAALVVNLICNNNCIFCKPFVSKKILSEQEIDKMENFLIKNAIELRKRGFENIEISGSDPIQYEEIPELVKWLKDIGFKNVEILTHGRNLLNSNLVKKLKEAKLDELRIPVYGSKASIHDSITNSKGSFQETISGLNNLKNYAPEIKLTLTSLIMKQNYKDMLNILKFLLKYSSNIVFGVPAILVNVDLKKFAISFGRIKPYLFQLVDYAEKNKINIGFLDIPFCVFGFYKNYIDNLNFPPTRASQDLYPKIYRSKISLNFPNYRIKIKPKICDKCKFNDKCDGFLKQYVELFGFEKFKPL